MKLRTPLATIVREMSEITNLPVDTLLEEAILQWVDTHDTICLHAATAPDAMHYRGLLSSTRHEGCDG